MRKPCPHEKSAITSRQPRIGYHLLLLSLRSKHRHLWLLGADSGQGRFLGWELQLAAEGGA